MCMIMEDHFDAEAGVLSVDEIKLINSYNDKH